MCEMLWTDPQEQPGRAPSKRVSSTISVYLAILAVTGRLLTEIQGVGLAFGPDVTRTFCEANGLTAIIRSHEVRQAGYAVEQDGLCITVFSAPNYCDATGNKVSQSTISQRSGH